MKIKRYLPRLEQIVSGDLPDLENKVIFVDDGVYHVFRWYQIRPVETGFRVTKRNQPVEDFRSLRDAMAWCSADCLDKTRLSDDILTLEKQRKYESADLAARAHMARKIQDTDRREAALLKVEHRRERVRYIENQLDKCINLAKYWQIQGFNNETARTGRTASNRTNR
jgi:hypothetical protein